MTDAKTGEPMRNLAEIMARLQDKKLPPVDKWNPDFCGDIGVTRRRLHRLRIALHVHGDGARAVRAHGFAHRRVAQAADVVDDRGATFERGASDAGFARVDRNDESPITREPLDDRQHAAQLFRYIHRLRAWPRRFTADVDDFRALRRELSRMGHRGLHVDELPAIGKRIRGHIHHPHEERAVREVEGAVGGSPEHPCPSRAPAAVASGEFAAGGFAFAGSCKRADTRSSFPAA